MTLFLELKVLEKEDFELLVKVVVNLEVHLLPQLLLINTQPFGLARQENGSGLLVQQRLVFFYFCHVEFRESLF